MDLKPTLPGKKRPALLRVVVALIIGVALSGGQAVALAQKASVGEYELKAVFLFNFVKFVKWPPKAFPDAKAALTIGILGDDPFAGTLERTIHGETVGGRVLRMHRSPRIEELRTCQIIFVSKSERSRVNELVAALRGAAVLTVGESEQFSHQGGVITLLMQKGRVGFEINVAAGRRAGLEISSKLLRLGKIVSS